MCLMNAGVCVCHECRCVCVMNAGVCVCHECRRVCVCLMNAGVCVCLMNVWRVCVCVS